MKPTISIDYGYSGIALEEAERQARKRYLEYDSLPGTYSGSSPGIITYKYQDKVIFKAPFPLR